MENKFTPEQIEKAKACKTVEELLAYTKENGIELTEAEAANLFAQLNSKNASLSDDKLEAVAGGEWMWAE